MCVFPDKPVVEGVMEKYLPKTKNSIINLWVIDKEVNIKKKKPGAKTIISGSLSHILIKIMENGANEMAPQFKVIATKPADMSVPVRPS